MVWRMECERRMIYHLRIGHSTEISLTTKCIRSVCSYFYPRIKTYDIPSFIGIFSWKYVQVLVRIYTNLFLDIVN